MKHYSATEKLLHKLALGFEPLLSLSFSLEKQFIKPYSCRAEAVYVTGLARSGTTALMEAIHSSNEYASLTYQDMPFVLAPNLWSKLTKFGQYELDASERAHGDGILITEKSPEAFEEVFWRVHIGDKYIKKSCLTSHNVDDHTLENLSRFQNLVCFKYRKKKYLAKNNNHILRLKSLSEHDENTQLLIVFRNPHTQTLSLQRQHQKFQSSKKFVHDYMNWLVHCEFGSTHKPFSFATHPKQNVQTVDLDYWLNRWLDAYTHVYDFILNSVTDNVHLICYERLCNEPEYWKSVCRLLGIKNISYTFRKLSLSDQMPNKGDTRELCYDLYQKLYDMSDVKDQNTVEKSSNDLETILYK